MMNRKLHTPLDLIKPENNTKKPTTTETPVGTRKLKINERVRMRVYHGKSGPKWARAIVIKKTGPLSYEVREEETGIIHNRHINQLIKIKPESAAEQKTTTKTRILTKKENRENHYTLRSKAHN
ncbi:unnamed protein product [Lasius platythorax]|uniref:Uncharacterized protein n=1 Tax=Lasius platythorax TaxID=488582 RepID=A0AAV2MZF4_9HYME